MLFKCYSDLPLQPTLEVSAIFWVINYSVISRWRKLALVQVNVERKVHCYRFPYLNTVLRIAPRQHHVRRETGYPWWCYQTKQGAVKTSGVCKMYGMQLIFRPGWWLCSLSKGKDPLLVEKQSKVVYNIPYSTSKTYIGESKRRLETRLKGHWDACQRGMREKSAVATHACIRWWESTVVDEAKHQHLGELPLKEALHIHETPAEECLNRDTGLWDHSVFSAPGMCCTCRMNQLVKSMNTCNILATLLHGKTV